ncbi:MAG: ThuA domain-containing protein [Bryobacteraceae bacterium]
MPISRRTLLAAACAAPAFAAHKPHVVFVCGDHEYSGEHTLPLLAAELERSYKMRTTVVKSQPDQNAEENIPGLEALDKADLAVFFLRWRRLPAEQLAPIERYTKSGRPLIGFRTSSHSFNYPKGHPLEVWNAWGSDAFGTPPGWGKDGHTHFGHRASTDVRVEPGAERHPVLTGVAAAFHVPSWLYRVLPKWPPREAERLLVGHAINPDKVAEENPVAWAWKNGHGARVFFTTMGHPGDFGVEAVQRLSINAVHWCLKRHVPGNKWKGRLAINVPYRGMTK